MRTSWTLPGAAFISAVAATLVFGVATSEGTRAQENVRRAERAEQILDSSCQTCHTRRVIDVQAKDFAAWQETINAKIADGVEIDPEEVPLLVEHLTIYHGPVPEGPGKDVLLNTCTMCHDLQRIKLGRRSSEEWEETLITMLNEGAPLNDRDFALVHHYLSRNFGVD